MNFLNSIWTAFTTRGPVGFVRNLHYIVYNYQSDLRLIVGGVDDCRERAETVERYVKKVTKVHVDIPEDLANCTRIVVIGNYRGKDHVQIFNLRPTSIDMLMDQLRDMERYADITRVESPLEIDATVKRSIIQ